MEQVQIGRRSVDKDAFITAVKESRSLMEVTRSLGFNDTVPTTRKMIKEQIEAMELNTEHFKAGNKFTEQELAKMAQKNIKAFTLSNDNQMYYDAFKATIAQGSWGTYKASIGNFMEQLKDKDFATVTEDEVETFTGNRNNPNAHIRSFMMYIVANDINNAKQKVSKDMLIWLITNKAKK